MMGNSFFLLHVFAINVIQLPDNQHLYEIKFFTLLFYLTTECKKNEI